MRTLTAVVAALLLAPAAGAQGPPSPPPPGLPPMLPDLPCPPGVMPAEEMPCVVLPDLPGLPGVGDGEFPGPIEESGAAPMPDFAPGFLNHVWKLDAEVDAYDGDERVLSVTVTRLVNLPKRFRDDDDEIIDADTAVLLSRTTRVYDADGHRVRTAEDQAEALNGAETVRVHGKVVPPQKWRTDEDDQPVPTIRAKRVYVTG
jgi:hypothetical protein